MIFIGSMKERRVKVKSEHSNLGTNKFESSCSAHAKVRTSSPTYHMKVERWKWFLI